MSAGEKNIIAVINDGLRCGAIHIPGTVGFANEHCVQDKQDTQSNEHGVKDKQDTQSEDGVVDAHVVNNFPAVRSVTQYLNAFGVQIAERIKGQFNPLFDPATEALSPEVLAVNEYIKENAGYSLYDAQLAMVETHKRCLERSKATLCIAECGSGKTKIGAGALHAYQHRHHFLAHNKYFNIVLCPSHMAKKWVREIEETLSDTFAIIVNSIAELNMVYEAYKRDNKTCYVIITKEKARDGYQRRPAVMWNERRREFICPDCYGGLEMELTDDGSKYKVPADGLFFRKETKQNRKCDSCGSILWTALAPEQQSDWVKVSDYGFVHRRYAYAYLRYVEKKPKIYQAIKNIADNPDGHFPNTGAYRRFSLSTYIKRKMRGKVDGLIIDELHDYNNNSGQGDAMGELFQAAKKVVGMTATLINGYSSGIFHLLYRISSDLMIRDNKRYEKPLDFNAEYGVTESVYELVSPDYNANRRTVRRKIRERQLPGVSPLVYSRFLMENAAFLSLNDMGKDLPEYEEIPIQLKMNSDVSLEYRRLEKQFIHILKYQKDIAKKILSVYLNLLTVYPDQPYGYESVKHPKDGSDLIIPEDTSCIEELHEKDHHVLDIVKRKTHEGERVLIYTSWTRIDTQTKLTKLLTEQGYRVAVLTAAVSPKKREEWVEKQVRNGVQVLICNPSLVKTGLDLNDFTAIVYYNISYDLFTLRQSSRRSWRINQRAPRIEVYFFYYKGTMQHRAIRLMASKLAVAGVIEGNLTEVRHS
jgi:superfamily II DNA or RNA helicase